MFDIPKIAKKPMPKGWKSPLKVDLYQVFVEAKGHQGPIAVSPAVDVVVAGELKDAINTQIAKGHEKLWSNPMLIKVKAA